MFWETNKSPEAVTSLTDIVGVPDNPPAKSAKLACDEDTSFTISWDADNAKVANEAVPKRLPVRLPLVIFNEPDTMDKDPENTAGPIFFN